MSVLNSIIETLNTISLMSLVVTISLLLFKGFFVVIRWVVTS